MSEAKTEGTPLFTEAELVGYRCGREMERAFIIRKLRRFANEVLVHVEAIELHNLLDEIEREP